jgi:hypothetical protein
MRVSCSLQERQGGQEGWKEEEEEEEEEKVISRNL